MAMSTDQLLPPERLQIVRDEASSLEAVIVIHSTLLGPAAGGCRLWNYPDDRSMADDACRLSEGMSYKNALAGLPLGGGKAVVRKPLGSFDRRALFRAFGRAVENLHGSYVTTEDVGTTSEDMVWVRAETKHVAGLPIRRRESGVGGDPSPWTARGVFLSMQLAAERHLERSLADCTVAVQGVGNVGAKLAEMLAKAGARLIVSDLDPDAAARIAVATGAELASVGGILSAKADIFAPCALGGVIAHNTVGKLQAKVVCGAANSQLAESADGDRLADRGILFAPDYVVNAGGIINIAAEYLMWSRAEAALRVGATADRLGRVLEFAAASSMAPHAAADALARETIAKGRVAGLAAAA